MFDVFYCVILNTIVYRFVNGDQLSLEVSAVQSEWKKSFDSCSNPTYWHQIFNDCQPESCNVSSVADKIIRKPTVGRHQYWIYGYVLRSPVIVNIGCYSLKSSVKNEFHRGMFLSEHNSALECSRACPNALTDYIFLRKTECLCIPEVTFYGMQSIYSEENMKPCTMRCPGNNGDICGGVSTVEGVELYSAYSIVNRKTSTEPQLENACLSAYWDHNSSKYRFVNQICSTSMMYICQGYNKTSKSYVADVCNKDTVSWFDARQLCYEKNLRLSSTIQNSCPPNHYWTGMHVVERITWGNVTLPSDALCLMLVIDGSRIRLETEKCNSSFYSLCYVSQHTSSQQENSEATSKPSTITAGRTTLRGPVNAESDSDDDKPDLIPIVAGSVGGFVALVIVVFIVCIVQRRKKSNNKHLNTAVDEGEPETYSEPIKNTVAEESRKLVVENTIPEENTKLVNVTEEGIYNHLGDSEKMIEMKPQDSSIYDVTGDDEYHVFTGNGKQQILKDDDDLYDHGAASDVYNTLNDTVTPNRPESDTYNVINAK